MGYLTFHSVDSSDLTEGSVPPRDSFVQILFVL
jgi:hypothetical protein